jgi:hypothetical protein
MFRTPETESLEYDMIQLINTYCEKYNRGPNEFLGVLRHTIDMILMKENEGFLTFKYPGLKDLEEKGEIVS